MQFLRQMGAGLIYGLASLILVIGGLSLALAESYTVSKPTPTSTAGLSPIPPTINPGIPGVTDTPIPTAIPSSTPPPPAGCPPPQGWIQIMIQPDDSLNSLAGQYHTTVGQLSAANCLLTSSIVPGYTIYVPAPPPSTSLSCGPIAGWVHTYYVRPGDTLFHIALLYGTTVEDLIFANCRSSSEIFPGEILWVPNAPTITPGVTIFPTFSTATEIPTLPLTDTPLPFTATLQPTDAYSPPSSTPGQQDPPTATITAFPSTNP